MKHMEHIGIRELKQNASAVVARVAAGETVVVTDRRRPVAQLSSLPQSPLDQMRAAGSVRPARRRFAALSLPGGDVDPDSTATAALMAMRDEERY